MKYVNIFAWTLIVAVILYAVSKNGNRLDSRTKIIYVDGKKNDSTKLDSIGSTEDFDWDESTTLDKGAQSDNTDLANYNNEAVALNDSGAIFLNSNNPQEASIYLKRAIVIDSNYARAHYNLGIAYQKLFKLSDAITEYHKAISLRPHYFEPAYNLGRLYSVLKDDSNAVIWLTKATEIGGSSRSAPAFYNLGIIYRRLKQPEKSKENYREALRYKPDFIKARFNLALILKNLKEYKEASSEFEKVAALGYKPAKLYRNLGICYSNLQTNIKAINAYTSWTKLDSSNGDAWYNLAIVKNREYDTLGAIDSYRNGLRADSSHYRSAFNLGLLYSKIENKENALKYYRKAIQIYPNYSKAYYNMALIYSELKNYDSAIVYYYKVSELDPENHKALFNLALSYRKLDDLDNAIKFYSILVDQDPTNKRGVNNLGTAYLDIREYDSAFVYFNRLVGLTKDYKAYFNRAKVYNRLDSLELSKRDYRTAILLKEDYTSAYHNLAILEEKDGNYNEAISLLTTALKYDNNNWKSHWKLGQIYVKLDNIKKAKEEYTLAAIKKPESEKFQKEYNLILEQD